MASIQAVVVYVVERCIWEEHIDVRAAFFVPAVHFSLEFWMPKSATRLGASHSFFFLGLF